MALLPETLPLGANIAVFAVAAGAVWVAGTRLAIAADEISDRLKLGKAMVGLLLLATATELPEIVTSLTAAAEGNAALVLGNLFGGITAQTAILALVDVAMVRGPLTSYPRRPTHALEGALLIVLLAALLAISVLGDAALPFGVGVGSLALALCYAFSIYLIRGFDEGPSWIPFDMPATPETPIARALSAASLTSVFLQIGVSSLVILIAGVALADTAASLARQTGLGMTFLGVAVLALSTSLPELSTTLAAARLGAYTLAISNIIGSNLIMVALILPSDLFYRPGPILEEAGADAQFAIISGIVVTAVYVCGILIRRTPSIRGVGLDSLLVLAVYLASLWVQYRVFSAG